MVQHPLRSPACRVVTHHGGHGGVEPQGEAEAVGPSPAQVEEGEGHEHLVQQRGGQREEGQHQHQGRAPAGPHVEHARVCVLRGQHAPKQQGAVHEAEAHAARCATPVMAVEVVVMRCTKSASG